MQQKRKILRFILLPLKLSEFRFRIVLRCMFVLTSRTSDTTSICITFWWEKDIFFFINFDYFFDIALAKFVTSNMTFFCDIRNSLTLN